MKPKKDKLHLTINQIVRIKYELRVYGYVLIELGDINLCDTIRAASGKVGMQSKGGYVGR